MPYKQTQTKTNTHACMQNLRKNKGGEAANANEERGEGERVKEEEKGLKFKPLHTHFFSDSACI